MSRASVEGAQRRDQASPPNSTWVSAGARRATPSDNRSDQATPS